MQFSHLIRNFMQPTHLKPIKKKTQTHLQPLAMGLHFDDHAGIRLGEGIPVWDTFAGDPQLYFGQAGAVEQAQRIGCRLIDVAHVSGDTCAKKKKKYSFIIFFF